MASDAQPLDLGILLAAGYQEFVRQLRAHLAEQGFDDLGRSDGYVFRALNATSMTVSELADRLEISKQGAGQIIEDMEQRGYVQRRPDPHDGRARQVHLAARGEQALAAAKRFHQLYERRLAHAHGAEHVATLRQLLTDMAGGEGAGEAGFDPALRVLYV
jgi:DNA-binding MarR family transcriptional regulator